jgi:hypothetical protein
MKNLYLLKSAVMVLTAVSTFSILGQGINTTYAATTKLNVASQASSLITSGNTGQVPAVIDSPASNQSALVNAGPNVISVKNFGAKGDGSTDDTKSIQDAIQKAFEIGGGVVYIPDGVYMIDATQKLEMQSNVSFELSNGAILRAIPNDAGSYAVVDISGVDNVEITGGTIEGERDKHISDSGEWGMGISIYGSKNVTISNVTVQDCWGDGVYIGQGETENENIILNHVVADGNRRNGITLISGENIQFNSCTAENSKGTAPSDGVDIEPNDTANTLKNISVSNLTTQNNAGNGLEICTQQLNNSGKSISINVTKQHDTGSAAGIRVSSYSLSGVVNVLNSMWDNNSITPVLLLNNVDSPAYYKLADHISINIQGYKPSGK